MINNFISIPTRRGIFLLFLLVVSSFFTACKSVEVIEFQALKASEVTLPVDVKTMALVNRNLKYDQDSLTQYYKFNGELRKDSLLHDSVMKEASYYGVMENFSEFLKLDTLPLVDLAPTQLSDSIRTYPKLSWNEVDSICALNNSDVLIVLEGKQINTEYSVYDGGDGFWGNVDIKYWAVWRVYDPLYQKIYDEHVASDSLFVEVYANSYNKLVEEKLPARSDILKDVSYTIGESYVKRLAPDWVAVKRRYYCTGDKRMDVACYHVKLSDWDDAIAIWKVIADNNTDKYKLAGRAAHNLAVAYELKGDFQEAIQWNRKSIYFYKQLKNETPELKVAQLYALTLLDRKKEEKQLNKFFGE